MQARTKRELIPILVKNVTGKSMDFFGWQGVRRPPSELGNDEQRRQAEKDAI
jgi:hypothetical protein